MVYMGNLVRSAYELKVQITADLDERLVKIAEENDKKSRWIKRDVLEEVEKMRVAIVADHTRRFQELAEPLVIRLEELEVMLRNERTEWVKAVESDRQNITALDTRVRALRRDLRRAMEKMGIESSLALDEAMSNLSAPNPASVTT